MKFVGRKKNQPAYINIIRRMNYTGTEVPGFWEH